MELTKKSLPSLCMGRGVRETSLTSLSAEGAGLGGDYTGDVPMFVFRFMQWVFKKKEHTHTQKENLELQSSGILAPEDPR